MSTSAMYLTDAWHTLASELGSTLPERAGVTGTIVVTVSGTPEGDHRYTQTIVDGRVSAQAAGAADAPDVTFALAWNDAVQLVRGDLDVNVAFMQGRMKVAGDPGKLLAFLPLTASNEYRTMQAALLAGTAFPQA